MRIEFEEMTKFIAKAVMETYASENVPEIETPWNPGFKELEYPRGGIPKEGWYYRDSYTGFFKAPGREVVYWNGFPVWHRWYDGGMSIQIKGRPEDIEISKEAFRFLKEALRDIDPKRPYLRSRRNVYENKRYLGWRYYRPYPSALDKRIEILKFRAAEGISYKKTEVFFQIYGGGLIIPKTAVKLEDDFMEISEREI